MSKKKMSLACSDCGSRNYSKNISEGQRTKRLEIKKFCKTCQRHTLHKATK